MPRKPIGETAMTDAERQARYRAARATGVPVVHVHRPVDHRGGHVAGPTTSPASCKRRLSMRPGWKTCRTAFRTAPTAEALRTICDLDLSELQAIIPPRGFGRD